VVDGARSIRTARPGIAATLAAVLVLLAPAAAQAEAFEIGDSSWEGCSEFLAVARAELGTARVLPVAVLDWASLRAEDGVLVLHPLHALSTDDTSAFMTAGGRLAILDDFGRGAETLERFRIVRTAMPARPVEALRNRATLAIAEPVVDTVAGRSSGPHPVVAGMDRLVTNHATALRHPNLSPVLRVRAIGEPDAILAVAGVVGEGRLFAMGDPSAITNQMLRYPGNRAFATGLVHYLADASAERRTSGRLFIVTNRFREENAFGGRSTLEQEFARELKGLMETLEAIRRDGLPSWLQLALAALGLLAFATFGVRTAARPYGREVPRYARPVPLIAQGGLAGRFAMLAAPSSPRALTLLELKSGLVETLALHYPLPSEPTAEVLLHLLRQRTPVGPAALGRLQKVLAHVAQVEASVRAGRSTKVSRVALAEAARAIEEVLQSIGEPGGSALRSPHPPQSPRADEAKAVRA
jgi:hypothetical protein